MLGSVRRSNATVLRIESYDYLFCLLLLFGPTYFITKIGTGKLKALRTSCR